MWAFWGRGRPAHIFLQAGSKSHLLSWCPPKVGSHHFMSSLGFPPSSVDFGQVKSRAVPRSQRNGGLETRGGNSPPRSRSEILSGFSQSNQEISINLTAKQPAGLYRTVEGSQKLEGVTSNLEDENESGTNTMRNVGLPLKTPASHPSQRTDPL